MDATPVAETPTAEAPIAHAPVAAVSTADAASDALATQFAAYIDSHRDDACQVLGLPAGTPIRVNLDPANNDISVDLAPTHATLNLSAEAADKVLAYGRGFGWANGVVVIPTLVKLITAGAFDALAPGEDRAMLAFAQRHKADPEKNLGTLWGAFNLIALQGWLQIEGADRGMRYRLTPAGAVAVELVRANLDTFVRAANGVETLQHCHALCHGRRNDPAATAAYCELVAASADDWGIAPGEDYVSRRIRAQLVRALDGLLTGPTWVALDMPVYERRMDELAKVAPSIFERFGDDNQWVGRVSGWPDADAVFLHSAWTLMRRLGQIEENDDGQIRLTEQGRRNRPIAAPFAGLPTSYLRSYARLQDLLFGNPDPLGVAEDKHIDRVMNVYASSGAGSGPAALEISDRIIRRLFDDTPLEKQPAGIADMGCGDASALKRLAEYVIAHTKRGRHLQDYPLLVVGADYNESARNRARATLASMSQHPNVHTRVVHADISRPELYDIAIKDSGLTVNEGGQSRPAGMRDFLHTFMFLVHNRRLALRTETIADQVLTEHLRKVDRARLKTVLERYIDGAPTVSDTDELPISLESLKGLFNVAYGDEHGIVPGYVAAADLVHFMGRWEPFIRHGFLAVEGHSPKARNLIEDIPVDEAAWMRKEKLPHSLNWGMHFVSRQFMMPFDEYMLAMCLAGFAPRDEVYGSIHPRGIPNIDRLTPYRFFSIADYVYQGTKQADLGPVDA